MLIPKCVETACLLAHEEHSGWGGTSTFFQGTEQSSCASWWPRTTQGSCRAMTCSAVAELKSRRGS
eukprot:6202000-Pleurochrysis_carterae.AAC.1